jgi:hypothetical protein
MAIHSAPSKEQIFNSLRFLLEDASHYKGADQLVKTYASSVMRLGIELGYGGRRLPRG